MHQIVRYQNYPQSSHFHLQLLLDFPPKILAQLLQLLRERRMGEMGLDAILHRELVQQAQGKVVVLKRVILCNKSV